MTKVNFSPSDYERIVADSSSLTLKNRYFEQNPFLTDDGASLISRPGLRQFVRVGQGPIRGLFSEPGTFNGDLFTASYDTLYRVDKLKTVTTIQGGLFNPDRGVVKMAITANIGEVPEYLFFADGRNLFVFIENGYAVGTLTGTPANTDVVRVDNTYYRFTNASVDAGTPSGTLANPWLVALGVSAAEALENLSDAFGATGIAGVQYSTALTANGQVVTTAVTGTSVSVRATLIGALGDAIITTETGAALTWGSGTLTGGGTPTSSVVQMPDDVGVIDVAVVNSFVIVIPAQGQGINGRFYWIEPGETTVDPLNFATAERSPDEVFGVVVIGDQFWLPGESTTEVWYVSNDPENRMQRLQGVVFDRGTWEGTAVAINEALIVCDADGAVFQITGGTPKRISQADVEEEIRKAIQNQQNMTP